MSLMGEMKNEEDINALLLFTNHEILWWMGQIMQCNNNKFTMQTLDNAKTRVMKFMANSEHIVIV